MDGDIGMKMGKIRMRYNYDTLIWILLIWCAMQEIVLSFFFKVTGSEMITKILFYSKDLLMLVLFALAFLHFNISRKLFSLMILYYITVIGQIMVSLIKNSDRNMLSFLSSARGLILLPTMFIIGCGVRNKERFFEGIKKYYKVLVFFAFVGIIELIVDNLIGTSSFWIGGLELDRFHSEIKNQPDLIFAGVPWNWHTDGKLGSMTKRRLISLWGAPLTSAAVLLLPCMYYTIKLFKNRNFASLKATKNAYDNFVSFMLCFIALYLTATRQFILPYFVIALLCFIFYIGNTNNNRAIFFAGVTFMAIIIGITFFDVIWKYIHNGSTIIHLLQIQESVQQLSFWGKGVGTFGTRFADTVATESQYITIVGQLGVIPLILYLTIFIYPLNFCRKKAKSFDDETKAIIYSLCLCGVAYGLAGVFSETVAAFTSMAQYYIFIGFAVGYCLQGKKGEIYNDKNNRHVPATVS